MPPKPPRTCAWLAGDPKCVFVQAHDEEVETLRALLDSRAAGQPESRLGGEGALSRHQSCELVQGTADVVDMDFESMLRVASGASMCFAPIAKDPHKCSCSVWGKGRATLLDTSMIHQHKRTSLL